MSASKTPITDEDVRLCRVKSEAFGDMVGADTSRKLELEARALRDCLLRARVIIREIVEDVPPDECARETSILDEMNRLLEPPTTSQPE